MSYYVIKPLDFKEKHVFFVLKKKDVPKEARRMIHNFEVSQMRKVGGISSLLQFLQVSAGDMKYTVKRISWEEMLLTVPFHEDWTTDSDNESTSVE